MNRTLIYWTRWGKINAFYFSKRFLVCFSLNWIKSFLYFIWTLKNNRNIPELSQENLNLIRLNVEFSSSHPISTLCFNAGMYYRNCVAQQAWSVMEANSVLLLIFFQEMMYAAKLDTAEELQKPLETSRSSFVEYRENTRLKGHVIKRFEAHSFKILCSHLDR